MRHIVIAGVIIASALFFLVRHFYRIFSGKGSACSCGTHKYTVKNGNLAEQNSGCSCAGCCGRCSASGQKNT